MVAWRDDIKTGSMTMPLTSVLLSMIKMLHTMLSCVIQLLALFVKVFPLDVCDSAAQAKVDGEQLVGWEGGSGTELCQY